MKLPDACLCGAQVVRESVGHVHCSEPDDVKNIAMDLFGQVFKYADPDDTCNIDHKIKMPNADTVAAPHPAHGPARLPQR